MTFNKLMVPALALSAMATACGGNDCENLCEDRKDCPGVDSSVDWDCEQECERVQKLVDESRPRPEQDPPRCVLETLQNAACLADPADPCCRRCGAAPPVGPDGVAGTPDDLVGRDGIAGTPDDCLVNAADPVCSTDPLCKDGCQAEYDKLLSCASQADDVCSPGCDGQIANFNLCMCQSQPEEQRTALCERAF